MFGLATPLVVRPCPSTLIKWTMDEVPSQIRSAHRRKDSHCHPYPSKLVLSHPIQPDTMILSEYIRVSLSSFAQNFRMQCCWICSSSSSCIGIICHNQRTPPTVRKSGVTLERTCNLQYIVTILRGSILRTPQICPTWEDGIDLLNCSPWQNFAICSKLTNETVVHLYRKWNTINRSTKTAHNRHFLKH